MVFCVYCDKSGRRHFIEYLLSKRGMCFYQTLNEAPLEIWIPAPIIVFCFCFCLACVWEEVIIVVALN
jgi:hypothetical protein